MGVTEIDEISAMATRIRTRVLRHVLANNGGYMSQACSSAELLATLYGRILQIGPSRGPAIPQAFGGVPSAANRTVIRGGAYNGAKEPDYDRFIFSPVHYALVLYAALIELGRLAPEGLAQFNQDGSTVEMIGAEHSPGIEVTAGSLAQALSQAAGMALARKLNRESGRVWVFMSDGEFQEGQTWETVAAATFHRLDNLGVVVDKNDQQCDGAMEAVMTIEPLAARLQAFGAACEVVDGHDPSALIAAAAAPHPDQPLFIIGQTDPCRGIELMRQRAPKLHYLRFKSDEEHRAYAEALAAMEEGA